MPKSSPKSSSALPLISVIIPVYNVKDYLPRCLDSVRSQTYKNLQIILVDDGSTDTSSRLCDIYSKLDPRALVLHQKNSGLSSARNAGLSVATGKYIFFLDSDDYLEKDCLAYLYKLLKKTNSRISFCSHYLCRENSAPVSFNPNQNKKGQKKYKTTLLTPEFALKKILAEEGAMLSSWGKLYDATLFSGVPAQKRISVKSKPRSSADPLASRLSSQKKTTALPEIRFPVGKIHEDVGTTYRLFLRSAELDPSSKLVFGSDPKYYYYLRSASLSNSSFNLKKLDLIAQTDQMCADLDRAFPTLINTTHLRRLHARFSVLRQLIQKTHKTEKLKQLENSLISFILEHKSWIFKNPEATRRDKLALASLSLGKTAFALSWKFYQKTRKL